MSSLFPPGVESIWDLPHHLSEAVQQGLAFISFDELPENERPPKEIWLDADQLHSWFASIKRQREERAQGKEIEDPVQNAAVAELLIEDGD